MKITKKNIAIICLIFASFTNLLALSQKNVEENKDTDEAIKLNVQKFEFILKTAQKNFVDSIDINKIAEKAFNAALNDLDAYSQYFGVDINKRQKESDKGESCSIGIDLASLSDTLTIFWVAENSPAEKAGLKRGDKLLFISGSNALKMQYSEAIETLSGEKGSNVDVIIKRGSGAFLQEYHIKREMVSKSPIFAAYMLNDNVGYVSLNKFSENADEDFKKAVRNLKKQGMTKLVLDLRNNLGGYVKQAIALADEFLPKGYNIFSVKAKNQDFCESAVSTDNGECRDLALIVLVNESSASSSEIFAGCMQDLDRGVLVGANTYGKGLVQRQWDFLDGSSFRITVGKYYTPSGRCLQKDKNNISAPEEFKLLDNGDKIADELEKALETTGGKTKTQVFKSRKGQYIFGWGGISPTIAVKPDTVTQYFRIMKNKNLFLEYAYKYSENKNDSLTKIGATKNYDSFLKSFNIDDEFISNFKAFSKSKNIWNEKMFSTDIEPIKNILLADIAQYYFGDSAYSYILSKSDKVIIQSLEAFPTAEILLKDFE